MTRRVGWLCLCLGLAGLVLVAPRPSVTNAGMARAMPLPGDGHDLRPPGRASNHLLAGPLAATERGDHVPSAARYAEGQTSQLGGPGGDVPTPAPSSTPPRSPEPVPTLLPGPNRLGYVGFGAATLGGEGQPVVRVTTLAGSGRGSLLEALSAGNRMIVFDVAGDITPDDFLQVRGANVTIDGLSAPPPGITVRQRGFVCRGDLGCHDLIIRGVRVRNALYDSFQIWGGPRAIGAYNVVLDRVEGYDAHDGNIDITDGSYRVTVSNSIFAAGPEAKARQHDFNSLIKYRTGQITLWRNLFLHATQRNPQIRCDATATCLPGTTVDMVNNVVIYDGHGVWVREDLACPQCPRVNVIGSYFAQGRTEAGAPSRADHAILIDGQTSVYVEGNVHEVGAPFPLLRPATSATRHQAPPVPTLPACEAAQAVLADAGAPHRDALTQDLLAPVRLAGCP